MRHTATYSDDPYLLMRLYTDLKLCGVKSADNWNNLFHPFDDRLPYTCYMTYGDGGLSLQFHNHWGKDGLTRFELTENNYTKVLTELLKP